MRDERGFKRRIEYPDEEDDYQLETVQNLKSGIQSSQFGDLKLSRVETNDQLLL